MDTSGLQEIPLFAGLPRRDLEMIARHADEVNAPAGTTLLREGDRGLEVMVVLAGEGRVTSGGVDIATVGPGEVIGEIGVVGGLHRTASVIAVTDMRLLVIFGPEFRTLTNELAEVRQRVLDLIASRLAQGGSSPD